MNMLCKNCGRQSPDTSAFCVHCGRRLEPARKGVRPLVWWLGGAVLLLLVCAVLAGGGIAAYFLLSKPHAQPTPSGTSLSLEATREPASAMPTLTPSAPTSIETPAPEQNADISDAVNLQWYIEGNGDEPDKDAVLSKVNDYLRPKINATVDLHTFSWGDYDTRIKVMFAAGEKFDLLFTANWAADYETNRSQGNLLALDALLECYGPDITKSLGGDFLGACAIDGKLYAIPSNTYKCHSYGLLLNKNLVNKYNVNVDDIKTLQDLAPVFARIKEGEKGVYPLLVNSYSAPADLLDWDRLAAYNAPGALFSNGEPANTKVINDCIAPESVAMYKLMRSYHDKGYINDKAIADDAYMSELSSGKYFAAAHSLLPGRDYEVSASSGVQWVQVQLTPYVMSTAETEGSMLAIPASSEHPDRAMMFCNLLYSDASLLNLLDYGIEGVHYVVNQGNAIKLIDSSGYAPGNYWKFGNQFLTYVTPERSSDVWERYEQANDKAIRLNSLGFRFDSSGVQYELDACKAVVGKYQPELASGTSTKSVDALVASFNQELKEAGVDALLAEEQRQFDAWKAGK
jgi:putative aldouronate transport system substrate-binding protein